MAEPSKQQELRAAWRALASDQIAEGWRTIAIMHGMPVQVRAGRYFPGNEEALLIGFSRESLPSAESLPSGRGFLVSLVSPEQELGLSGSWICLRRMPAGSIDLFALVAGDILDLLASSSGLSEVKLLSIFLVRVRAWQDFMSKAGRDILTREEEVGLFGELHAFEQLIEAGAPPLSVAEAWEGPLDGLHDFVFGGGALEIKSTVSAGGFTLHISSLDQLDCLKYQNIFLYGLRFVLSERGEILPEKIEKIKNMISDQSAIASFGSRVIAAGYRHSTSDHYNRRFEFVEGLAFHIDEKFPKLSGSNVAPQITRAEYDLDINQLREASVSAIDVFKELGAI